MSVIKVSSKPQQKTYAMYNMSGNLVSNGLDSCFFFLVFSLQQFSSAVMLLALEQMPSLASFENQIYV